MTTLKAARTRRAMLLESAAALLLPKAVQAAADATTDQIRALSMAISSAEREANALKLPSSQVSRGGAGLPLNDTTLYRKGLPRLLTVLDRAGDRPEAKGLADEAGLLLSRLNAVEHVTPDQFARTRAPRPSFASVKQEYATLFDSCTIRSEDADDVQWYLRVLVKNQTRYEGLAATVNIPWYFIGIIHGLEASFNFHGHLHNGDPLSARTVDVPRGRPLVWLPPSDWESSAKDALDVDGFLHQSDWTVEHMLYRWESYNGFGSRMHHIHTPYLWSFSNQYSQGKYIRDDQWSATAVSDQCGGAVMLKGLMNEGVVQPPRA